MRDLGFLANVFLIFLEDRQACVQFYKPSSLTLFKRFTKKLKSLVLLVLKIGLVVDS